jgi:uncharacterized protein (DUF2267 family)
VLSTPAVVATITAATTIDAAQIHHGGWEMQHIEQSAVVCVQAAARGLLARRRLQVVRQRLRGREADMAAGQLPAVVAVAVCIARDKGVHWHRRPSAPQAFASSTFARVVHRLPRRRPLPQPRAAWRQFRPPRARQPHVAAAPAVCIARGKGTCRGPRPPAPPWLSVSRSPALAACGGGGTHVRPREHAQSCRPLVGQGGSGAGGFFGGLPMVTHFSTANMGSRCPRRCTIGIRRASTFRVQNKEIESILD